MKGMRLLPAILMLLLIGSVNVISLQDCFASHTDNGNVFKKVSPLLIKQSGLWRL